MKADNRWQLDNPRRRAYLLWLLCSGTLASTPAGAFWFAKRSRKLAADRSVLSVRGDVDVNGRGADKRSRIRAGDRIRTGPRSEIVFVVGGDSFLLRGDSELETGGSGFLLDSLRLLTGRLLSVFAARPATRPVSMRTPTATIGIRGTGIYVESEPDLTYVCTCYGQAALGAADDPADRELITTTKHESPRYVSARAAQGTRIRPAPIINHSNEELQLLEEIVGRQVPPQLRLGYGK